MNLIRHILLACLFVLPILALFNNANNFNVQAVEDDPVEGEDSDVNVETGDVIKTEEEEDSTLSAEGYRNSPDADITYMFTKPVGNGLELPVGKEVHFLVGFMNKGQKDFFVDTMDASFRYSADFSYYLQNFTALAYNRIVKPKQEVTFSYQFFVSEAYSPRPYGLTINLYYRDADNIQYLTPVFNETVSIVELDEGLDSETFFLFIVLGGLAVLALIGMYQLFQSYGINDEKKEQLTRPSEYLDYLSKQLMNDYAKYFQLRPTAQIEELDELLENLLTHMEEFYGLIEQIRNNGNQYLDQFSIILFPKIEECRKLFAFIDKLERIVNHVSIQVSLMEREVSKAEKMMGAKTSKVKKLLSILTSGSQSSESQSKFQYILQDIFKTEDLLKM
ncbi:translocon-associated protein subunit alpha-like isoform X2 [Dermatophagoides pteronyssinus]|uniref:translocon-associated protein subunit alpha-like isoform X2 n=1 Tax=Dermatophagoides pteronyssinus TaxID=6956 RepID=UPI003F66E928